jgi:hypothetical protein
MNYFRSKTNYTVSLRKLVSVTCLRWDLLVQMSRSFERNTEALILLVGTYRWARHIWETNVHKHSLCQKKKELFCTCSSSSLNQWVCTLWQATTSPKNKYWYTTLLLYIERWWRDADGICPKRTQVCSPLYASVNSVCVWNQDHGPNESNFI